MGTTIFNADEHFWFYRTQNFIQALSEKNWAQTYQNPKPGITVMFLSGISLDVFLNLYEKIFSFRPEIYTYDTFPLVSFATKAPLVLINIVGLFILTLIIKKLLDEIISIYFLFLLALQPYFIGISRYFHGDGTLTIFMTVSAIILIYATSKKSTKFYAISAIFAGLATLTKLQGFFLFPFLGLMTLIELAKKEINIKESLKIFLTWIVFYALTIFIAFPALWVNPIETLNKIYAEAFLVTAEGKNAKVAFNPYLVSFPMIVNFTTISLFVAGLYAYFRQKNKVILYSLLFILFYSISIQIIEQKSERYLLPLFPFISLIAAFGLSFIKNNFKKDVFKLVFYTTIFFNMGWLLWNFPYYTAHAELQPWGAVYYEAAEYLNKKPNAQNLKVVAIEKPHTFRPFFKGKTYGFGETLPKGWSPEYVITGATKKLPEKYVYCVFEKDITFRFKDYWKIYKCK